MATVPPLHSTKICMTRSTRLRLGLATTLFAGMEAKVGGGTSLQRPSGVGGKGNEGVAACVRQITGGIGYVEYAYALQNKLAYSRMKNAAGKFVLADDKAFAAEGQAQAASLDDVPLPPALVQKIEAYRARNLE